jgi:DNA repair exonuclease SbcCD nuclease subunit
VLYPGSIERTSIAEAEEDKGFMVVELVRNQGQVNLAWTFRRLPARPLVRHDIALEGLDATKVEALIRSFVAAAPRDAVMTVRLTGAISESVSEVLSARFLRAVSPPTMNLEVRLDSASYAPRPTPRSHRDEELDLPL